MGRNKKMGRREKKKMKKEIITDGGREDRISNLPESLIHHILSFLLMRDVIRTCPLSKRWRNIWKTAPVLRFGVECRDEFIEQSLVHYEGQKILAYAETIGLEIPSLSATCLELGTDLSKCVLVGITSLLRASRCIERLIIDLEDPYLWLYDLSIFEGHDIDAVEGWKSLEHALSVELPLNTILIRNFPGYCFEWHRDWFNGGMKSNMENFLEYIDREIKLVEVLLMSSKRLNKMNISIKNPPSEPFKFQLLYYLTKKLLVFPRASAKAEVYFS